jgi:hypothetical protein
VAPVERAVAIRSRGAFLAALVILLALPVTVIASNIIGGGDTVIIHFLFAAGFVLLSFAVFDFKVAGCMTWLGCLSMAALAVIFFGQGLAELTHRGSLHDIFFDFAGQGAESVLIDLFIVWSVVMLLSDTEGKTRVFGFLVMGLAVFLEVHRYSLSLLGDEQVEILKVLLLLPVIWLLLESRKHLVLPEPPPVVAPSAS